MPHYTLTMSGRWAFAAATVLLIVGVTVGRFI